MNFKKDFTAAFLPFTCLATTCRQTAGEAELFLLRLLCRCISESSEKLVFWRRVCFQSLAKCKGKSSGAA